MSLWRWDFSMGRKAKISTEDKVSICEQYLNGVKTLRALSVEHQLNIETVRRYVKKYQVCGANCFIHSNHNNHYSKEFKKEVVDAYLNGNGSIDDIANQYGIPSVSTVENWILKYNNLEELKDYDPKPEVYMKKEQYRKTTLEERNEIVQHCLKHDKDYKGTAKLFDVSYAQVYQWVKKYQQDGKEGLADRRGKRKEEEQLNETEILQRKVKLLEKQLREKEMENELLKKVKEIERRRSFQGRGKKHNI